MKKINKFTAIIIGILALAVVNISAQKSPRTMEQQIGDVLVREQLLAMLSSAFSGLALLLSCIGLYGVVSYDVTRSLRDLGIRMALGAQRLDVLRRIIRGALSIASPRK